MTLAQKYRPNIFEDIVEQDEVKNKLQEEIETNTLKNAYLFIGNAGQGKAQPLYSKLLTPNGYINMGEVQLGDEVFGEDGKPHKVIGVFPQGKKDIYEITFSDGMSCRCSDEHLWTIRNRNNKEFTYTLSELMEKNLYVENHGWRFFIPISKPINFESKSLNIHPYLLGVLLGDGCFSGSISVSLYEDDIKDKVENILSKDNFKLSYRSKYHTDCKDFGISDLLYKKDTSKLNAKNGIFGNRLTQHIYDLGLYNHKSSNKFIPKCYLFNSYKNRLLLLQGLIDTDGTVVGGAVMYSTSSKQLAEDVVFLVQSLGGTCSCNEHEIFYTYKGERKQGLNNFELYIRVPKGILPFTSLKHGKKYKESRINPYRSIRKIEYIGEEECQCILVDNPSHLYLTDNMIVTHNTTLARIFAHSLNAYVLELDMASHGTAEDMRNLIDNISNKPIGYDYYVIILDEVQAAMSRKDSMAAQVLLKTLEEPPKHCIFILCTTEGDKIIDTIKSRCETYMFAPISYEGIYNRLKYICEQENIKYEANALHRIVKAAKGGMRQAITYLDVINDGKLTEEATYKYFGCGTYDSYFNLLYAICDKDTKRIIESTMTIDESYIQDFFSFIIDVSIYFNVQNLDLIDIPSACEGELKGLTHEDKELISILRDELLNLQYEGKNSPIIRQLFIATILKIIGA